MNQFLIATHSTLATGFLNTVKFFNNTLNNIDVLDCYTTTNEVEKELRKKVTKYTDKNLIILTDIAGGSVNQIAAKLLREYKFQLVSGINLAIILELVLNPNDITPDIIRQSISKANVDLSYMNDKMSELPSKDENDEL